MKRPLPQNSLIIKGCPMKAVCGRCVVAVCLMSTFVAIFSGCTVGGKSFAIDSNSRIPFFGLELKERKPKSTAPVYQSISRTKRDSHDVKVALQFAPTVSGTKSSKREKRLAATSVPGIQAVLEPASSSRQNSNEQVAQSISLPVTDEKHHACNRRSPTPIIDFQ